MIGYRRDGFPGQTFLTRQSDAQCARIDPCGYRCGAGVGGHDGPHLFEEHEHLTRREPLDVERLARALEAQMYSYPPPYTDRERARNARDFVLLAENVAAEYARLEAADAP